MQKRAKSARAEGSPRRLTRWLFGLTFAGVSAAGFTRAFEVTCEGKAVAIVTVSPAPNERERSKAMVSACRTGGAYEQDPKDS